MDQPKLERMLHIMILLTTEPGTTVPEIAEKIDISKRSVYRYIDTMKSVGFIIEKKGNGLRMDTTSPFFMAINNN